MFADDEQARVEQSPAREVADRRAATDRTSRLLFQLEDEIKRAYHGLLVPFLSQPAVEIEKMLYRFPQKRRMALPLSNRYGTYGYYIPPGLAVDWWRHPDPGYQDLDLLPRVIVMPHLCDDDLPFGKHVVTVSLKQGDNKKGLTAFTKRPLMIMIALTEAHELIADWSDVEAVGKSSFAASLQPLWFSFRQLLRSPHGIIARCVEEEINDPGTEKVSARISRANRNRR